MTRQPSRAAASAAAQPPQPAPVMKAYQAVRAEGEKLIRDSGMNATIIRPWYVLGPGHRWAYALIPMYWLFEHLPGTRETARRLGLLTREQMIVALLQAVEAQPDQTRILDVPAIRSAASVSRRGIAAAKTE